VCFFMYFIVHAAFVRIKLMMMIIIISLRRSVTLNVLRFVRSHIWRGWSNGPSTNVVCVMHA